MKQLRGVAILLAALAATTWGAPAFAQEGDSAADDVIDDVLSEDPPADQPAAEQPAEGGEGTEASAPADGPAPAATEQAKDEEEEEAEDDLANLDPDDKLYWSTVRGIFTMQKRAFQKGRRFGITVYGGLIPNNVFEQYVPLGIRLNYFILENIGVELAGSYALKVKTGLQPLIEEEDGLAAQQVLIGDSQVSHTNFGIVWSPFYGKTAFYDNALSYFDMYLFAGAGLVVAETTPTFNAAPETDVKPEGALGAGLAFYAGQHFTLRVDFRQFVFQKVEGVGGVANPSEVSLGAGYFF